MMSIDFLSELELTKPIGNVGKIPKILMAKDVIRPDESFLKHLDPKNTKFHKMLVPKKKESF